MRHRLLVNTWLFLLFAAAAASSLIAQDKDPVKGGVAGVADEMGVHYKTVIGVFAEFLNDSDRKRAGTQVKVDLSDSLENNLNAIVAQAGGWRWEREPDGAIHLSFGDRPSVLDLPVASFSISKGTRTDTLIHMRELNVLRKWMHENSCSFPYEDSSIVGQAATHDPTRYTMSISDTTIAGLLDEVSKTEHAYYWRVFQDVSQLQDENTGRSPDDLLIPTVGRACYLSLTFRQVIEHGNEFDMEFNSLPDIP